MHDSNDTNAVKNSGLFVDWLSIWQVHPAHIPLNKGSNITTDGTGATVFEHTRAARIQGSYSTSCAIKSDGSCVVASGNFGRLNRKDNLFNFDPLQTLQRANAAAQFAGLPAFSIDIHRNETNGMPSTRGIGPDSSYFHETRAKREFVHLSRIDLTKNFRCGSVTAARSVLRAISGKSISRVKKGVAGDESVWWANTRYMLKVYIKALEMEHRGVNSGKAYEYAVNNGILRIELELKRREIDSLGWSDFNEFVRAWDMGNVHKLFGDYEKVLTTTQISNDADFLDALPHRLRVTASAWLSGRDVRALVSRATFFRYRRALLDYGIDLNDERPASLTVAIRQIEIEPVCAPDWYVAEAA